MDFTDRVSTIYADATATETVTSPTYVAASTVTVISTAVNFELRKRGPQPAPVTAAYGMIKRQASATPSYNTVSALLSACACGNPDPGTTSEVCTATSVCMQVFPKGAQLTLSRQELSMASSRLRSTRQSLSLRQRQSRRLSM